MVVQHKHNIVYISYWPSGINIKVGELYVYMHFSLSAILKRENNGRKKIFINKRY